MATRHADGFEDHAAAGTASATIATLLGAEYVASAGSASFSIVAGRKAGTLAIRFGSTACNVSKAIGGTQSTMFQSFALASELGAATLRSITRFMEGAICHVSISLNNSGQLEVHRGDRTTLLGTSAAVATSGAFFWIQVRLTVHDTTGSVEIRDAAGATILALTAIDTRNAGTGFVDTVQIGHVGSNGALETVDDWHVWDTTGSICNTWTNDSMILSRYPTGAGNSAQHTPSAGANWENVDDLAWDTTTYNQSTTAGHKDSLAMSAVPVTPANIWGIVRTAVAQNMDAGARQMKMLTRSGGTDYVGSAITLNLGSYTRLADVQEVDPVTGVAWTKAGLDAAESGYETV